MFINNFHMLTFHLLSFKNLHIFEQLQIEEALLRNDDRNWCLINYGSPPAIVLGISGAPFELVSSQRFQQKPLPLIRRFSGGGTVIVDHNTYFYTLIGNRSALDFACSPQGLMQWTEKIYRPAFSSLPFRLVDNDYALGDRKFGGNAQYITKDRWVHHSSFLWDFEKRHMDYLLMPKKIPSYRQQRQHQDFLCRLSEYFSDRDYFARAMVQALEKQFCLQPVSFHSIQSVLEGNHRRTTQSISYE